MIFPPRSRLASFRPLALLAVIALAEYASPWRLAGRGASLAAALLLSAGFVAESARHFRLALRVRSVLRTRFIELALTVVTVSLLASKVTVWTRELADPGGGSRFDAAYHQYGAAFLFVAGLRLVAGALTVRRALRRLDLRPAQTVAIGFAGAILAGTVLLSLPMSVTRVEQVRLLDALFTSASAVTVTGLAVYDPGTFLTPFGQAVLLGLIQLGGLGTMATSASLVVLAGRRLRLERAAALQEAMDLETVGQVKGQLRTIIAVTAAAEATGAIALYLLWRGRPDAAAPAFAAVFHAVSAFCNAGFSIFPAGLVPFRDDLGTLAVVSVLIVVGGLGVPVVASLCRLGPALLRPARRPVLSLHSRLALVTSAILLGGGALAFLALEGWGALAGHAWPSRLTSAAFLSVTARTAGFNTIDTAALAPATLWLLMLVMFVGGSPGSTAGGIKTTTAATVVAALWSTLSGRPHAEAFRRTLPDEQVARALAVVAVASGVVALAVVLLLATQPGQPLDLVFEAVSAFATVGLSTGVTAGLNGWGKVVIIGVMFIGRTGPLTLGFALAARARRHHVTYPAERVMIG